MKKILLMLLLCTPLLYMGCKAEPEWVNLIAQQEQEKGRQYLLAASACHGCSDLFVPTY